MTKVVILCGGMGTRLREETEYKPKPLVEIGDKPIIWHIMKHYSFYGFNDFILCLGYKGHIIKNYFLNFKTHSNDFTVSLRDGSVHVHSTPDEDWNVTCVDTGQESLTGERLRRIAPFIAHDPYFMVTYGDGVGDVDIPALLLYHKAHGKIGTLTGVKPLSKYGTLRVNDKNDIQTFVEKPQLNDCINSGYIVFSKEIFQHLDDDMFEKTTLPKLAEKNQLQMFMHNGFWHCMDTYRDYLHLNELWQKSQPWKVWGERSNISLHNFEQTKKKILIIGASGFLGTVLYTDFSKDHHVVGTYFTHREEYLTHLDITNKNELEHFLNTIKPDVILQPAAQPWVDFCEEHHDESYKINVQGAQHVIDWCSNNGAYYLFLSTDYVFDGAAGPYTEVAVPSPINVYGRHKLAVEQYALAKHPLKSCIVRTVGVYGWEKAGKNFVTYLIKTLHDKKNVFVPVDQDGTPIHVSDLSAAIQLLIQHKKTGIYHAGGPENISRYDFSLLIAKIFGCDSSLIKGVPTSALRQTANRPKKAGLISTKIQKEFGIMFKNPYDSLVMMQKNGNPYTHSFI